MTKIWTFLVRTCLVLLATIPLNIQDFPSTPSPPPQFHLNLKFDIKFDMKSDIKFEILKRFIQVLPI